MAKYTWTYKCDLSGAEEYKAHADYLMTRMHRLYAEATRLSDRASSSEWLWLEQRVTRDQWDEITRPDFEAAAHLRELAQTIDDYDKVYTVRYGDETQRAFVEMLGGGTFDDARRETLKEALRTANALLASDDPAPC